MGEGPSSLLNQRCRLSPAALWLLCCLLGPTLVPLFPNQTTGPSPAPPLVPAKLWVVAWSLPPHVRPGQTAAFWTA